MPEGLDLSLSTLLSEATIYKAFDIVIPIWLDDISGKMVDSAQSYASRFGAANRQFTYSVAGSAPDFVANITCTGPYVETTAWDTQFSVPVGGFQYGDTDPLSGEQFPGGRNRYGTFITLVDKPEAEGEDVKSVSRSYTKYSGQTITKPGFFSQSIRKNIGEDITLSDIGKNSLQMLGVLLGKEIARGIAESIKIQGESLGLLVTYNEPGLATITDL